MNNDFDNILREKWEEKQFPVDDAHRKQMVSFLDAHQRRKRGIFWWTGGLALVIISLALIIMVSHQPQTPILLQTIPVDSISITQKSDHFDQNNINESNTQTGEQEVVSEINKNERAEYADQQRNSSHPGKILKANHTSSSVTAFSHGDDALKYNNLNKRQEIISSANNFKDNDHLIQNNVSLSSPVMNVNFINSINENNEDANEANPLTALSGTPPLTLGDISEIKYQISYQTGSVIPSKANNHPIRFFTEAGTGFISASKPEYSSGLNFIIGGGVSYKLFTKTNLLLSAGYLFQDGGFDFERTSTVQAPGFGTRSNFNRLSADKLHFVYSKLGIQYELKRHLFSLLGGGQWLYGAQGTIAIATTDQLIGSNQMIQYAWLKTDGMRHILWSTELFYGYRLTSRISILGGTKYYFSSIEAKNPALSQEGYYWNGHNTSFVPSFIIKYHVYGNR